LEKDLKVPEGGILIRETNLPTSISYAPIWAYQPNIKEEHYYASIK
jgi:hypothetical protein